MGLKPIENESFLLQQISCGDEKAFSILFYHYLPVLQVFALKFTKSPDAAEEIIQDTFLRLWLNRDKLERVENVNAYLYRYVSNECLSYLRKALREAKNIDAFKADHSDLSNSTIESIHHNEINRLVAKSVDNLPAQRKKIYQLSRIEGKNIQEIAALLKLSPNTVKNALVTALKAIRADLKRDGILLSFVYLCFRLK